MAAGSIVLASGKSSRQVKRSYRRSKRPNKQLATVGTVKRLISSNVDRFRQDSLIVSSQNMTTTTTITSAYSFSANTVLDELQFYVRITNPTLGCIVRILFFQWKDTTTPVEADILSATGDPLSPIGNSSDSQRNCGGKMHMLSDIMLPVNTNTYNTRSFKLKYYKKKLLPIKYDGAEVKNRVYIAYLSDTAVTPPVLSVFRSVIAHNN